jgi:hypothetical protein
MFIKDLCSCIRFSKFHFYADILIGYASLILIYFGILVQYISLFFAGYAVQCKMHLHISALHRTAPHRTAPHRTAPHRTAPHRTAQIVYKLV